MTLLNYERLDANKLTESIILLNGEFLLVRNPFRWKKNGAVIPNAYESFGLEGLCEDRSWEIVEQYGDHIAICKDKEKCNQ